LPLYVPKVAKEENIAQAIQQ
jgi:hypothetical protein